MKKIYFWWYFITSSSFRGYVYMHDQQRFLDEIMRKRQEMLEYTNHEQTYP